MFLVKRFWENSCRRYHRKQKNILYIKALEFARGEDLKELNFWYGIRTENIDKVYAVENILKN